MAAMAMAVGVRADSWHRAVPRRTRWSGSPASQRGEGVRAVGLGRPHRVEAEALGFGHQLRGVGRRAGAPVAELQSELHVLHGFLPGVPYGPTLADGAMGRALRGAPLAPHRAGPGPGPGPGGPNRADPVQNHH